MSNSSHAFSEQLEEGEIVDDDDFEDISDNSIIEPSLGKSLTSSENLRAHSLSSDSCSSIKNRKKLLHKTKSKHHRKRKKQQLSSDSSDEREETIRDLKIKLKEAIHVNEISAGCAKNDLGTRLKAMTGAKSDSPEIDIRHETVQEKPENEAADISDKVDDHELENLRMEALKTAVLNKFQKRKRKKAQELEGNKSKEEVANKENQNLEMKKLDSIEEDEDILRADLLVDLVQRRKKLETEQKNSEPPKLHNIPPPNNIITKTSAMQLSKLPVKVTPVRRSVVTKKIIINKNLLSNKNNVNNNNNVKKIIPKPVVKPLIINVNDDSDSDESVTQQPNQKPAQSNKDPQKLPEKPAASDLTVISNTVDRFLKQQRLKFETKQKQNVINNSQSLLEKSAVKLLPKSQQIEYQQLLRRLKNAERRNRFKKLQRLNSNVIVKNGVAQRKNNTVEAEVQVDKVCEGTEENRLTAVKDFMKDPEDGRKKSDIINELTTLKQTLKEIRIQRNGSLQIKSKYQVLTPIMKKITEASNERKKHEQRIKHLAKELKEARSNLSKSHQKFSTFVRELVRTKDQIDKSLQSPADIDCKKSVPITSTPIKPQRFSPDLPESISSITNHECEDMDICNSDETDVQIDIVDPNDIDQIFTRKNAIKSNIPEYVSPLNLECERYNDMDPLGIMCPYEVNGSCRDLDCTFKHYLINHKRH